MRLNPYVKLTPEEEEKLNKELERIWIEEFGEDEENEQSS